MKKILLISLAAMSLSFAGSAMALDESVPVLCASVDVMECVDGGKCRTVLPEEVNAPTFFRLDLENKRVAVSKDARPNKAENFQKLDGRIVMQGVDTGDDDVFDSVAWTIQVEETTARMVATAVLYQAAIVIFGACTEN